MASSSNECFLIVFNVSKRHNIGTLIRCATAFNVTAVCLVGSRHFSTHGCHGSDVHVSYRHYGTLEECCGDLKTNHGCQILGIEITDSARPVHAHPWAGSVAFMLGNEGQGLSERQMRACDAFVYIPQYGAGTASLNVAVAASIVLHHYAVWAGFPEASRTGSKFDVAERPAMRVARGTVPLSEEERAEERARRAGEREDDAVGLDFSAPGLPAEGAPEVGLAGLGAEEGGEK